MLIEINTGNIGIDWGAKGTDRIKQNIINLLNTNKYEVAYDRVRGMSGKYIDKPLDQAVSLVTAEIYEVINRYEPRASLKSVNYAGIDGNGNIQFKVVVDI